MAANTCNCINLHNSGCSYLTGETCFEQGCGSLKNADRKQNGLLEREIPKRQCGRHFCAL